MTFLCTQTLVPENPAHLEYREWLATSNSRLWLNFRVSSLPSVRLGYIGCSLFSIGQYGYSYLCELCSHLLILEKLCGCRFCSDCYQRTSGMTDNLHPLLQQHCCSKGRSQKNYLKFSAARKSLANHIENV